LNTYVLDRLTAQFPEAVAERYADRTGAPWAVIKPGALREVAAFLKNDPELDFKLFVSADGVDRLHLAENDPRFEVVYFMYSLTLNEHVRLKVRVNEGDALPSLVPVYRGADWWERFVWDFYGLKFEGHPNLVRILLYEEFKGHPLRKDYRLRDRQPLVPERPLRDLFRGPGTSGVS